MLTSNPLLHRLRCAVAGALFLAVFGIGHAASVSFNAALHIKPTVDSPVVGELPSGTSITSLRRDELSAAGLEDPPPGWVAIRSSGPFTGFVRNRDVESGGAVRSGSSIHAQPLPDAPLLLVTEEGDAVTAREPVGDWSRATIRTELIVFAYVLPPESRSQIANLPPMPPPSENIADLPDPASTRNAKPAKASRKKAPKPEPVTVETAGAPRTFEGYLLRTRRFLGRGPKFDYQLVDENNQRIALLDLSALLATSPLDTFENRRVSVYGPGLARPDVQDVIIRVQTLKLVK